VEVASKRVSRIPLVAKQHRRFCERVKQNGNITSAKSTVPPARCRYFHWATPGRTWTQDQSWSNYCSLQIRNATMRPVLGHSMVVSWMAAWKPAKPVQATEPVPPAKSTRFEPALK
jgi:hypothetical protein